MKTHTLITLFLLSTLTTFSQSFNQEQKTLGKSPKLLGKINQEALSSAPYDSWFTTNKEAYEPDKKIVQELTPLLSQYTIEAYMGTWCGDSKREVPRMYKVLEKANFNLDRLTLIGVDNTKENYKQSPGGEHEGKTIHRVPTFIIKKNGKEIQRIVESPVVSLENDLLTLITKTYTPQHFIVSQASTLLKDYGVMKFTKKEKAIAKKLLPVAESLSQLNTYGNVLYAAAQYDQAIAILRLNTILYPKEARVYRNLASTYESLGDHNEALKNFKIVLQIDPTDDASQKAITRIQSEM